MVFKDRVFLSLKWKLFALLAVTFTIVAVGISWATYVFQEKQLQRERVFHIERNSLELSAQIKRTQQGLIDRLDYINFGVLQGDSAPSLDQYIDVVNTQAPKLMLISGMQSISIISYKGQRLYSNDPLKDPNLSRISQVSIENEKPVVSTSCQTNCSVYAAVPVLLQNEVVSIAASAPLSDVIAETYQASGWDVGIYLPKMNNSTTEHWSQSILAISNYAKLMPMLKTVDFNLDSADKTSLLFYYDDFIYELISLPINLSDGGIGYWLLISDVTSSYSAIKENTLQLLAITWIALLLCALWLARLAQPNLLGLGVIPSVMRALAKHDFEAARAELNAKRALFDKAYPDELSILSQTTHEMAVELERLDTEMEDRNCNLQKSNMELAKQRDFVSGLLDNAQAIIVVQNSKSECISINKFGRLLLGKTENQCIGQPFETLFGVLIREAKTEIAQVSNGRRRFYRHEGQLKSNDGISTSISWMHSTLIQQEDQQSILSIGMDITEQRHVQHQLHWLAIHDPLTELLNRSGLQRKLQSSIQKEKTKHGQLAVVFCNLDHFKRVNDAFGHPIGDKLLTKVAAALINILPAESVLSRWGGDEFVVLFEGIDSVDDAMSKALLCQKQLNDVFILDGKEVFISASIGVSVYPDHGLDANTLVKNADVALFKAKQEGRNRIEIYNSAHDSEYEEKISLDTDLRYALARNELYLQYQPQICAATHEMIGAEALIRWNHPVHGFIPPDRFIPLAEESGQIIEIGEWVIQQACEKIIAWEQWLCPEFKLSVNVAGPQIIDKRFVSRINNVLNDTGIAPERLELEITETFIMTHPENTVAQLKQLKELGITLAIDDFGTGYSSLSYLKSLPIDKLKIDKSFVFDIGRSTDDEEIAKAIIALGHSLGLKIIAEGVESSLQAEFLTKEKCDQFQGYFFSRPLSEDDCQNFLEKHPTFNMKTSREY